MKFSNLGVVLLQNIQQAQMSMLGVVAAPEPVLDYWQAYQCSRRLQIYKKRLSPQGLQLLNSSE